jgi:hypothetical protein
MIRFYTSLIRNRNYSRTASVLNTFAINNPIKIVSIKVDHYATINRENDGDGYISMANESKVNYSKRTLKKNHGKEKSTRSTRAESNESKNKQKLIKEKDHRVEPSKTKFSIKPLHVEPISIEEDSIGEELSGKLDKRKLIYLVIFIRC